MLELLKFSATTQILDMLNTFYLTIADFYLKDFTYFPTVFLRCRLLPFWLSYASFSLFQTFSSFWPCVSAEEIFRQVGLPCTFLSKWHVILYFISAITHAQKCVRHHICSSLHLQCTGTFSVVLSLAETVLRVIFLLGRGSGIPSSIVSGSDMSEEVG